MVFPSDAPGEAGALLPFETFLFVVDDVEVTLKSTSNYSSESGGSDHVKKMRQAFFFDGTDLLRQEEETRDALLRHLFLNTVLVLLNVTVILSLFLLFRIKEIAKKMTDKIIWVYETLERVTRTRRRDDTGAIQLLYKASSLEINELQLNFNKVAKTLSLADSSTDNKNAFLNYVEAYNIFGEFDKDHSQRGVCLMNMGTIMARKGDLIKAL